jgi:hypothetical protein
MRTRRRPRLTASFFGLRRGIGFSPALGEHTDGVSAAPTIQDSFIEDRVLEHVTLEDPYEEANPHLLERHGQPPALGAEGGFASELVQEQDTVGGPSSTYEDWAESYPDGVHLGRRVATAPNLRALVQEFLTEIGSSFDVCSTVRGAHGICDIASEALWEFLQERGVDAEMVVFREPTVPPTTRGWRNRELQYITHDVVRVADTIIDLTARQFDRRAPFPLIEPTSQYMQRWRHLQYAWGRREREAR